MPTPCDAKRDEGLVERFHRQRVDAGERLVEQQKVRLARQAARDLESPLFASRQLDRERIGDVFEAELRE